MRTCLLYSHHKILFIQKVCKYFKIAMEKKKEKKKPNPKRSEENTKLSRTISIARQFCSFLHC